MVIGVVLFFFGFFGDVVFCVCLFILLFFELFVFVFNVDGLR